MNTVGAIGAAVVAWSTGTIIQLSLESRAAALEVAVRQLPAGEKHAAILSGYDYNFLSYSAAYAVSALCWRFIDPDQPIVPIPQLTTKT
jgi:hypothetical protein